ncbi:hypothetical protein [Streptomyces sp. NPDC048411]|uniref:hypothetical protein n=1 Tax=Streptomyces sp. NPDC048411 TaxID=3157206 RepID=UPI003451C988
MSTPQSPVSFYGATTHLPHAQENQSREHQRVRAEETKANTARRTCPHCRTDAGYVIPPSLGMCVPCAYPEP